MRQRPTNIDFEWYAKELFNRLDIKPTKAKISRLRKELMIMHSYGYKDCQINQRSMQELSGFFKGFNNED